MIRPGELSLAHQGVLFLDELPEFDRRALEVLREPMEERVVHLTRAGGVRRFPADFIVLAAMNPCPCGWFGQADGRCRCTPRQVSRYVGRLSGPLLDRFDMRIALRPVPAEHLLDEGDGESSDAVRERVVAARAVQSSRWGARGLKNGGVPDRVLRQSNAYTPSTRRFLVKLLVTHRLSARAIRRMERVARTIADLGGAEGVSELHLMEALGFRLGGDVEVRVDEACPSP